MGRFSRFMAGRRGVDQLCFATIIAGVAMTLASSIVSWFALKPVMLMVYVLLQSISALLFIASFFRMFSRNISAREVENRRFLLLRSRFTGWFKRDRRHYRYLRCPGCKIQLRVPRGKGTIVVTCPKCHHETRTKT